jgi:type II secretory pathway component PulJ
VKLGEALTRRADLQKRIAQLGARLQASGVVQEGDTPPEDPVSLLAELSDLTAELERLITLINLSNAAGRLEDGQSVTAALARRDVLTIRQGVLRSVVEAVTQTQARYSRSEIRLARQVDVGALRREIDDLARERRELDIAIQAYNWTADLIEADASG